MRIGWTDLLTCWRRLAGGAESPVRGRIDPVVAVPRAAAHLVLFGVEPAGFRVRIVGSEVGRWAGMLHRFRAEIDNEALEPARTRSAHPDLIATSTRPVASCRSARCLRSRPRLPSCLD